VSRLCPRAARRAAVHAAGGGPRSALDLGDDLIAPPAHARLSAPQPPGRAARRRRRASRSDPRSRVWPPRAPSTRRGASGSPRHPGAMAVRTGGSGLQRGDASLEVAGLLKGQPAGQRGASGAHAWRSSTSRRASGTPSTATVARWATSCATAAHGPATPRLCPARGLGVAWPDRRGANATGR